MEEAWNLKPNDERTADTLLNFIIFCEDGEVEAEYFNSFAGKKIKISPIRNAKQHHRQVDHATDYCRDAEMLDVIDGKEVLKFDDGTQVWCVYDRDKEPGDNKETSFNDSIAIAESRGIRAAWSNDDFELWILLHFEDVDPSDKSYHHRSKYYERLTEIFKAIEPRNDDERTLFEKANFDYYKMMKTRKRFVPYTLQHMKNKLESALTRSKKLEDLFKGGAKTPHQKCPCTMVHKLVEEIMKYQ